MAEFTLPAEARSDDGEAGCHFDALAYFQQASDDDLEKLAGCGFGGNYPADDIAYFYEAEDRRVSDMLRHCEQLQDDPEAEDHSGFEVRVEPRAALDWIRVKRPALYERLVAKGVPEKDQG